MTSDVGPADPPSTSEPIFTSAPIAPKLTISSSSTASVLMRMSRPVRVTTDPNVMRKVSASKMKPVTLPSSKESPNRMASVLFAASPETRSVMMAETGLPGRNFAPPDAT